MQSCQVPHARSSQVWAEALDAWSQQLAQEKAQELASQALTPANLQAYLQLVLGKGHTSVAPSTLAESVAKHPIQALDRCLCNSPAFTHARMTAERCQLDMQALITYLRTSCSIAVSCISTALVCDSGKSILMYCYNDGLLLSCNTAIRSHGQVGEIQDSQVAHQGRNSKWQAARLWSSVNINRTPLHTAGS